MAFPASPSNNQVHKETNGKTYVYDSALGTWDRVGDTDRTDAIAEAGSLGTVTSGNIGSAVIMPSGSMKCVFSSLPPTETILYTTTSQTPVVAFPSIRFPTVNGRKYQIHSCVSVRPHVTGTSTHARMQCYMYHGTVVKKSGDTSSLGTKLENMSRGRNFSSTSDTHGGYHTWATLHTITAAATGWHYFHVALTGTSTCTGRLYMSNGGDGPVPWSTTVYEIMP